MDETGRWYVEEVETASRTSATNNTKRDTDKTKTKDKR